MRAIVNTCIVVLFYACSNGQTNANNSSLDSTKKNTDSVSRNVQANSNTLDTGRYNLLMLNISNGDTTGRWPVKHDYPLPGAVLPFNRVIAYYGNLFSNRMGALAKWPKPEMMERLAKEVKEWNDADSVIKAIPALHYIYTTAQPSPGKDGKYRYRMPLSQIDTVLNWAKEINAIVFLDIQLGFSTLQQEIPRLEHYLSMPNVHLGIDPEFALAVKRKKPGTAVGSVDATDVNYVSEYLAGLVKKNNIPPKILMVHRFTPGMVTNTNKFILRPEVQIVMDMDGWGKPAKKKDTYHAWIFRQPVQFTGFKLFYVNDTEKSGEKEMMSKAEVLKLVPKPIYIQYQ
jgi:hypothetical protein